MTSGGRCPDHRRDILIHATRGRSFRMGKVGPGRAVTDRVAHRGASSPRDHAVRPACPALRSAAADTVQLLNLSGGNSTMAKLSEVFGVSREVPLNYTIRESADTVLLEALTEQKHIVIHGSSKQGKTNLWKNTLNVSDYLRVTCLNTWTLNNIHEAILKAAGYKLEGATSRTVSGGTAIHAELQVKAGIPLLGKGSAKGSGDLTGGLSKTIIDGKSLDLDLGDVNDIILALTSADAPPYIILDDFHYLPPETQENFAVALKAFHEASTYTFVIVGVWLEENRLLQHNGDLSGRSVSINADHWSFAELRQVITAGEELLNVEFSESFISRA